MMALWKNARVKGLRWWDAARDNIEACPLPALKAFLLDKDDWAKTPLPTLAPLVKANQLVEIVLYDTDAWVAWNWMAAQPRWPGNMTNTSDAFRNPVMMQQVTDLNFRRTTVPALGIPVDEMSDPIGIDLPDAISLEWGGMAVAHYYGVDLPIDSSAEPLEHLLRRISTRLRSIGISGGIGLHDLEANIGPTVRSKKTAKGQV